MFSKILVVMALSAFVVGCSSMATDCVNSEYDLQGKPTNPACKTQGKYPNGTGIYSPPRGTK